MTSRPDEYVPLFRASVVISAARRPKPHRCAGSLPIKPLPLNADDRPLSQLNPVHPIRFGGGRSSIVWRNTLMHQLSASSLGPVPFKACLILGRLSVTPAALEALRDANVS